MPKCSALMPAGSRPRLGSSAGRSITLFASIQRAPFISEG